MSEENRLRELAIEGIISSIATENIGIFPAAWVGKWEKRSDYQNGWNDCAMAHTSNKVKVSEWLSGLGTVRDLVTDLLIEGRVSLMAHKDEEPYLYVNCSDEFFWGSSDLERIELDELPALLECYEASPKRGGELWCARKRGMRPQWASYKECYPPSEWPLFDAAGPERTDPDGVQRR